MEGSMDATKLAHNGAAVVPSNTSTSHVWKHSPIHPLYELLILNQGAGWGAGAYPNAHSAQVKSSTVKFIYAIKLRY